MRLERPLNAKVRNPCHLIDEKKNQPGRIGLGPGLISGRVDFRAPLVEEVISVDSLGSLPLSGLTAREG